jgi:hypothetical protein
MQLHVRIHYQEAFTMMVKDRLCCEINYEEEDEDKI